MINQNFSIPQAVLDVAGNIILDVSINQRSYSKDTGVLLGTTNPDTILLPHYLAATNDTGLNLEYIYLNSDTELNHYLNDKKSFLRIYSASTITGATATGLANDGTLYEATFIVNGTPYEFSVAGSSLQTYTAVLTQINTLLTGVAVASLEDLVGETTNIQVLLSDYGLIRLTDGISGSGELKLFESLAMTIQAPFHNIYAPLPFVNNAQLNDNEPRGVKYVLIVTPGGASAASLEFNCSEYTAI